MQTFTAPLELIGINPFVQIPAEILAKVFEQAGRSKGPVRVCGTVNGRTYQQTLVRYAGQWRLYVNLTMLDHSPRRIGEVLVVAVAFNPSAPSALACPALERALAETPEARRIFDRLPPSRQVEVVRYLARLKTEASLTRNLDLAIGFLLGKNRFVGRDRP
ncbi:YdeI/OmpD-associated family protein [Hymenobacter sp.]|uniref:YdeI/OmpD-associated family protein n=1 Tax=Hymenobacter sp. TaxID=1898978 RepID=UPI00286A9D69|nr:YdeI/OmpD-associated family protein [Hymenobacter sp.]